MNRREFSKTCGLAALGIFANVELASAAQIVKNATPLDLSFVNPELRKYARKYIEQDSKNGDGTLTRKLIFKIQAAEKTEQITFKRTPPVVKKWVPVPNGAPDVAAYLINVSPGTARPAIIHMHGGGFVAGTAKEAVPTAQEWARELDCFVATIEYRLAPEARYDTIMEENYAVLYWVYRHAVELGVDPKRIAVLGESAGGGLAALLALTARDRGEVPLIFQALIYPELDDRTGSTVFPPGNEGRIIWTAADNRLAWHCFLGQAPGTPNVPRIAVPARQSVVGLPPAFIGVGSIDLFLDEDMRYANRLAAAGIETQLTVVPGAFHGFDVLAAPTELARTFTATKMKALRRAFIGND